MTDLASTYGEDMRDLAASLIRFDTTGGNEAPAQSWLRDRLDDLRFETYEWEADPGTIADRHEFPDADELDVAGRPSVAGVLELGDPDAGRTLVLNGHADVVPAEEAAWEADPFEPRWVTDGNGVERLVGRGAADMKSQLAACVFAARHLADRGGVDGRIVVESVAGEEEGGFGAAAAAHSNPYPFERDAAIVAEPTDMRAVTATEGALVMGLEIEGRQAHAARRWRGEDAIDRFEAIREAFRELEAERAERVTHPLYERFETPWPVVFGRVEAGSWASNVPGELEATVRIGVAPGESLRGVEEAFRERLDEVVAADSWLAAHPPRFERSGVQFAAAEVDPDEDVVRALGDALDARGRDSSPVGETYGSDARHYLGAGIPTVVFGPGRIEEAHFPEESIRWGEVIEAAEVIEDAAWRFLSEGS